MYYMNVFTEINLILSFREIGDKIKAECHINGGLTSDETIIDYNRLIVADNVTSATIDSGCLKSMSLMLLPVYIKTQFSCGIVFNFFPVNHLCVHFNKGGHSLFKMVDTLMTNDDTMTVRKDIFTYPGKVISIVWKFLAST